MKHRREYTKDMIGENLRLARERKGFSVADVREYLQLGSVQAIYKYESGLSYPPADTLLALMELYDIDRIDLMYQQLERCEGLQNSAGWNMFIDRREQMQLQLLRLGQMECAVCERRQAISQYGEHLCR